MFHSKSYLKYCGGNATGVIHPGEETTTQYSTDPSSGGSATGTIPARPLRTTRTYGPLPTLLIGQYIYFEM